MKAIVIAQLVSRLTVSVLVGALPAACAGESAELIGTPSGGLRVAIDGNDLCTLPMWVAGGGSIFESPSAITGAPDAPVRFTVKVGGNSLEGELQVAERDGKADVVWSFAPATDLACNTLMIGFDPSIASLAGATWKADEKSGAFPRAFNGQGVFDGNARSLSITFSDGRAMNFAFPQPVGIHIQDNRQWSGTTYQIRMTKTIGKMTANERSTFAMTLAIPGAAGFRFRHDRPMKLTASDEWVPLKTELDIEPGSALDFSGCGLADGLCGGKGRVIATPEGHFAYAGDPGTPRRFYGVNLCFTAQYLPKEQVDRLLDRLVRLGYNAIRIHHYESNLTTPAWKPGFDWDPARVDRLDYLMAGCAKRGLWITTDLYVSRPVPGKQIGLSDNTFDADRFKILIPVYEPAYQDWAAFARKFLDRVNPYTGKRVAEEPALAWISVINEPPIGSGIARKMPEWIAVWNKWLASRYPDRAALAAALGDLRDNENPTAGTVAPPADAKGGTRRSLICQAFLADTETAMIERMRKFLREELKCPALLTDMNCSGPAVVPLQAARAGFDYVDDHFYVDHPVGGFHPPTFSSSLNPIRDGAPGAFRSATVRLWGKPLVVSEFNYAGPGCFRSVGAMLTGAMAALQDWDALWRFAYSHKDSTPFTPEPIDYFNLANDPLQQASDRAAVLLYLRRDLKTASHRVAVVMPRAVLQHPSSRLSVAGTEWLGWITRIGSLVVEKEDQAPRDAIAIPLGSGADQTAVAALLRESKIPFGGENDAIRSETGEIVIDKKKGLMCIDTPRTAGGYADPGLEIAAPTAGVKIGGITQGATVFVSSLDANPIRGSARLLVTHLTDLQNTGARYADSSRQTLLEWGTLPHLVRDGAATVRIALPEPKAFTVWALSTGGKRKEQVAAKAEGGELVFTARVRGPDGARLLYEVVR